MSERTRCRTAALLMVAGLDAVGASIAMTIAAIWLYEVRWGFTAVIVLTVGAWLYGTGSGLKDGLDQKALRQANRRADEESSVEDLFHGE